jgi:hypothetical protein
MSFTPKDKICSACEADIAESLHRSSHSTQSVPHPKKSAPTYLLPNQCQKEHDKNFDTRRAVTTNQANMKVAHF